MAKITVDIFEKDKVGEHKTVRHVFYGKTKNEAREVAKAHKSSDKFYKAALTKRKRFKGIQLAIKKLKNR